MDDAPLLTAARTGDRAAFAALVRRHNQVVYRAARGVLRDDADAEDAAQQAWVKAYRALASFDGRSRFSTWVVRIAINEALMKLRARKPTTALDDEAPVLEPTPEERAASGELLRVVEAAVDRLSAPYRVVFTLREVQGLSTAETADALSLSEEAVKTRLSRAKAALRADLADRVDGAVGGAYAFDGARCDRIVARVLNELNDGSGARP
jgi:RNA polymerase sigma-70 factor, ECF subfamily